MSDSKMRVVRPFGPSIGIFKVPSDTLIKLNNYVEEIIHDEKKIKELAYGETLAGNVKQELRIEGSILSSLGLQDLLGNAIKQWIKISIGKEISKLDINSSWIVRQFENEYNPSHYHSGHISGVCYLKLPKSFGKTFQPTKKKNYNGAIHFIEGRRSFNASSEYLVYPEVGDFFIFPAYLMHTVYPFYGKGERRSLSFNAKIDEKIFQI